jgi:sporulation protein YlmC with PRC-barrel domain
MDNMKHRRLQELKRSDFDIVDGEPDIRGWDVKNAQGKKIGEVEELIVDAQQKKVRYMVVDLDDNEFDLDDREVLIPIGLAQLHQKDDDVILPNVQVEQLSALPEYDDDNLNANVERQICTTFGRSQQTMGIANTSGTEEVNSDFYQHEHFNDDNLYANRLHEARPVQKSNNDYERGLRLWERRSEGGVLSDSENSERAGRKDNYTERQRREEESLQAVRNNRNDDPMQDDDRTARKDNSIKRRTRDEGLSDKL